MQTTTLFFIVFALLISVFIAYFQYFYKINSNSRITVLLFILKSLAVFFILLLFINPTIVNSKIINEKPNLIVLADNSKSIDFFNEKKSLITLRDKILNDEELSKKFLINSYSFDTSLHIKDTLNFTSNQTNISSAIKDVNTISKNKIAPIILLTDGNQTIGEDYEFINFNQIIYPIVLGDTTKYKDLKISQLNVNKYSYLNNSFPIEVILNYDGKESIASNLLITKNGNIVYKKKVSFSANNRSKTVNTSLKSKKEGLQYYNVYLEKLINEKNIKNNKKSFSVEVINEQTKIAIISSILHPDIGALKKAIESNKQRSVEVYTINNFQKQVYDFQLVIIYQPNRNFNKIISQLSKLKNNFFFISGKKTEWDFINDKQLGFSKNVINTIENYTPNFNNTFLTFLQEDIGFSEYPPLEDKYGEIDINFEYQSLLNQDINGVSTNQPLLSTFENNKQKVVTLFGEGIWKWRANSFLKTNSFEEFDMFIANIIQYLASTKKRKRLEVNADAIYSANETIYISAFYTDKTFKFDDRANLEITVTNTKTKKSIQIPFSLVNNSYQVALENLSSGEYTYKVNVNGQNINAYGKFEISPYSAEEQFTNPNKEKLNLLADKTDGTLFYKSQFEKLKKELLTNPKFYTIQKYKEIQESLLDWKWFLFLIVALFSLEWFIRKYHGKI